ncbi:hypothetical protein BESB_024790 [Besnoitia besnoiti]|uniref:non-specific serine/threonine protein kinase n=1 Tax=Besnoitia besnoiti TaxID=94643 RepID=A0A2A9M785_BESBE|nr:uncharacterized protein BESB_024790 [Besnoitia besnoiti]PFH31513.1 hypothetical protein BESB_024790 [Besnoitia besnoiti]
MAYDEFLAATDRGPPLPAASRPDGSCWNASARPAEAAAAFSPSDLRPGEAPEAAARTESTSDADASRISARANAGATALPPGWRGGEAQSEAQSGSRDSEIPRELSTKRPAQGELSATGNSLALGQMKRVRSEGCVLKRQQLVCSSTLPINTCYHVGEVIGVGTWGTVQTAVERFSGLERVVKRVCKETHCAELPRFRHEIALCRQLDHPNIARLYETFEDHKNIYLVLEYCRGGDLLSWLHARQDARAARRRRRDTETGGDSAQGEARTEEEEAEAKVEAEAGTEAAGKEEARRDGEAPGVEDETPICSEAQAARFMVQLFSALSYLHQKGIAHRDIKLENLLLVHPFPEEETDDPVRALGDGGRHRNFAPTLHSDRSFDAGALDGAPRPQSRGDEALLSGLPARRHAQYASATRGPSAKMLDNIALVDFGFARRFTPGGTGGERRIRRRFAARTFSSAGISSTGAMTTQVGTIYYLSPFVLKGLQYDEVQSDMWAAGVVLFMLISGVPPFDGNTEAEVASKILTSPVQFLQPCWQHVSEECKDLIRRLLYNPFLSNASPFYSASLPASYEDLASLSGAAARPLSVDFLSVTRATAVPGSFMCAASPFAPWSSPASSASSLPPSSSLPSSPLPSPLPSAPRSSSPSAASSSSPGPPSGCPLSRDGASGEATMQDSFEGIAGQPAEAVSCFPAPTATPAEGSLQTGARCAEGGDQEKEGKRKTWERGVLRRMDAATTLTHPWFATVQRQLLSEMPGPRMSMPRSVSSPAFNLGAQEARLRFGQPSSDGGFAPAWGGGEPCTGGMGSTVRAADALAPSASLVPSVASGGGAGSSSPPPSPASWISPVSGAFRPAVAVQPPAAAAWLDGALQKSSRRGALGSLVEGGEKRETEIFVGRSSAQAASASGAAPGLGADGARRQAEAAKECVLERDDEARTAQNRPALDRMRERGPQEGEREGAQGQSAETPCAGVQTTVFVATTVTPSSPPGPPAAAVSEQAGCPASSLSPNACWDAASSAELTERQYGTRLSSAKSPSRASSGAATQPPGVFCPLPQLHPPSQSPSPCVAGVSAGAPSAFVPPAAPLSSPPGELPPPQLTPCLSRVPASLCPVKPEEAGVFRCRFLLLLSATAWRCFAALGPLQRALRTVLAREMEDELEVRILREVFCALDRRHRGTLAPDDFVWGLNVAREMVTTECSCWVMVQAKQEALVPSGCVGLHASDSTASLAFSSVSGKREALSCCSSQASLPVDGDPTGGEREPPEQRSRETSATEAADALARFVADRPERISVLAAAPLASAALPPSLHSLLRLASAGDADGDGPAVDQILPYLMNLHALLGVAPPDVLCEYFALPRAPPWTRAALCTHARATEGTAGDAVPQNRDQDDLWTIDDVIAGLDTDGSGSIEFVEFLAATLADVDLAEREALSRAAFRYFDRSFDGLVSYRDLLGLLTLQPASLASPHSPPPSSWCVPPARASYASTPPAASGASFAYSPYPMSASPAGDCARGTGVGGFEDGVCDPGAELELGEGEGFLMDLERVTAANLPLYRAVLKQIQAVDEDKDGFINYDEFLRLLG